MPILDCIVALFCRIDDAMADVAKDPRALLWPSEVVTLAVLFAIKGKGPRPFYRWLKANYGHLFPRLPERTRLFRLFAVHQDWADRFLAAPTLLGISDSYGVELIHPKREGRSDKQIGKKGKSNHRWIIGAKFCPLINSRGQIVDWDTEAANVYDGDFQRMFADYADANKPERAMGIYVDSGFHRSDKKGGDLPNLKICKRGQCNVRMLIETLFSMLDHTFGFKKLTHRVWAYLEARMAFVAAAYNLLISWGGQLITNDNGYVQLSIAQFVL